MCSISSQTNSRLEHERVFDSRKICSKCSDWCDSLERQQILESREDSSRRRCVTKGTSTRLAVLPTNPYPHYYTPILKLPNYKSTPAVFFFKWWWRQCDRAPPPPVCCPQQGMCYVVSLPRTSFN